MPNDAKTARVKLPMSCRCGPDNAMRENDLAKYVRQELIWGGRPIHEDARSFLAELVAELNQTFNAYVEMIACDMWFLVSVRSYSVRYPLRVSIECDDPEDGLAHIVAYLHEKGFSEDA